MADDASQAKHSGNLPALSSQPAIGVLIIQSEDPPRRDTINVAPHSRISAGRAAENELVLTTAFAARRHFAIIADASQVYVEDNSSVNGTWLNDVRVDGRAMLRSGDIVRIDSSFQIEFRRAPDSHLTSPR